MPKGPQSCDQCGTLSRAYAPCSLTACSAMCDELYKGSRNSGDVNRCVSGCKKYAELKEEEGEVLSCCSFVNERYLCTHTHTHAHAQA